MATGYYWLNQRGSGSGYNDEVGEVYHYRGNTPGKKQLSEGDRFIYYMPGEYVIFGTGKIGTIEKRENTESGSSLMTEYFAHIEEYREIHPPIRVRKIKDKIPFLRDRQGLSGVPQTGIRKIDEDTFETILSEAKSIESV